jgi:hypothetical protein
VTLHTLLTQSLPELHVKPFPQGLHAVPPQSGADSWPFLTPSVQLAAWHTLLVHTRLAQSPGTLHAPPGPHAGHVPPQSTLVSEPLRTPSLQAGA